MQSCSGAIAVVKSILVAVGIAMLFNASPASAEGPTSQVEVIVCPTSDLSRLAVLQPQNDSKVSSSEVVIQGEVEYISQIDFFINDIYNHTIAIGATDTTFETSLTVSPGTNTIKLEATARCSLSDQTQNVVITYQPDTPPSVGEDVNTVVDDRTPDQAAATAQIPFKTPIQKVIDDFVVTPIINAGRALDIVAPPSDNPADKSADIIRSFAVLGGIVLIFIAIISKFGIAVALSTKLTFLSSHTALTGLAGGALIILAFILQ